MSVLRLPHTYPAMRHRSLVREVTTFAVFICGGICFGVCLLMVQPILVRLRRWTGRGTRR
jgi:hypothetical protein